MQTETRPRKDDTESTTTAPRREARPNRPFEPVHVRAAAAPYSGFPPAPQFGGYGGSFAYGLSPPITAFGTAGSFGQPFQAYPYAPFPQVPQAPQVPNAAFPQGGNPGMSLLAPLNAIAPTLSYGLAGLADLLQRGVALATTQGQLVLNAVQAPFAGMAGNAAPNQVAWPNARLPATDIVDEGAELVLQVELPGVKPENVDVAAHARGILVTAQAEPDIDLGALVQAERGFQATYRRSIVLPTAVQPSGAKARLRDGVLTINLPKVDATEGTRRIPVEA